MTIREGTQIDIATITLDRVDEGNALNTEMLRALTQAFRNAASTDAKVILLRGNGPDFCRGRDRRNEAPSPTALAARANLSAPLLEVYEAIAAAPQPVVAAVQGAATGFGTALATACDITLADPAARFRLPEMEKGVPPTLAISAMMRRVPQKALAWLVYSMQEIDAATAERLGIVSAVTPPGALDQSVTALLATLTAHRREALVGVKEYLRTAPRLEPQAAADYAGVLLATILSSNA